MTGDDDSFIGAFGNRVTVIYLSINLFPLLFFRSLNSTSVFYGFRVEQLILELMHIWPNLILFDTNIQTYEAHQITDLRAP